MAKGFSVISNVILPSQSWLAGMIRPLCRPIAPTERLHLNRNTRQRRQSSQSRSFNDNSFLSLRPKLLIICYSVCVSDTRSMKRVRPSQSPSAPTGIILFLIQSSPKAFPTQDNQMDSDAIIRRDNEPKILEIPQTGLQDSSSSQTESEFPLIQRCRESSFLFFALHIEHPH